MYWRPIKVYTGVHILSAYTFARADMDADVLLLAVANGRQ